MFCRSLTLPSLFLLNYSKHKHTHTHKTGISFTLSFLRCFCYCIEPTYTYRLHTHTHVLTHLWAPTSFHTSPKQTMLNQQLINNQHCQSRQECFCCINMARTRVLAGNQWVRPPRISLECTHFLSTPSLSSFFPPLFLSLAASSLLLWGMKHVEWSAS